MSTVYIIKYQNITVKGEVCPGLRVEKGSVVGISEKGKKRLTRRLCDNLQEKKTVTVASILQPKKIFITRTAVPLPEHAKDMPFKGVCRVGEILQVQ